MVQPSARWPIHLPSTKMQDVKSNAHLAFCAVSLLDSTIRLMVYQGFVAGPYGREELSLPSSFMRPLPNFTPCSSVYPPGTRRPLVSHSASSPGWFWNVLNRTLIKFASCHIVPGAENILSVPVIVLNDVQLVVLCSSPEALQCDQKTAQSLHQEASRCKASDISKTAIEICVSERKKGRQRQHERKLFSISLFPGASVSPAYNHNLELYTPWRAVSTQDADRGLRSAQGLGWPLAFCHEGHMPSQLLSLRRMRRWRSKPELRATARSPTRPCPGAAEPQPTPKPRNKKYNLKFWACLLSSIIVATAVRYKEVKYPFSSMRE